MKNALLNQSEGYRFAPYRRGLGLSTILTALIYTLNKLQKCCLSMISAEQKRNIIMRIKLSAILLLIGFMQLNASVYSQQVTLNLKDSHLESVFKQIRQQTGYDFVYNNRLMEKTQAVTISIKNAALLDVLDEISKKQPLQFEIIENTIVVKEKAKTRLEKVTGLFAPPINIKGRVVDSEGRPLIGASIGLKGLNQGTTTNSNGEFVMNRVPEDEVLVISFLGYEAKELKATANLERIELNLLLTELENVIINTGYQKISRERSAGSFAKPDMEILEARSGTTNVLQRLDGLIPGLVINNSSSPTNGEIGSSQSGNSIMIRGLNTLNASRDPLIVLNGVPIDDVSKVNPNDVEDITVLKDATSASIWGAKAANGVIVITTKKGKMNESLKIDYDGFVNFQGKPDIGKLNMLNSAQFIEAAKDVFDPVLNNYNTISQPGEAGMAPIMPHETILYNLDNLPQDQVDAKLKQLASQDGVAQMKDLFYRDAMLMNHTLSATGGVEKYNFYGSISYTNNKNSTPGDKNRNYGLNLRQDLKFGNRIKLFLITDFINNDISSLNPIQPTAAFLPYVLYKNPDGTNADLSWLYRDANAKAGYEDKSGVSLAYSPLDEFNRARTRESIFTGRVNSGLSISLFKGLRYEGVYSLSKAQSKFVDDMDQDHYNVRSELVSFTPLDGTKPYLPETGGHHRTSNSIQKNWTVRNQLIFDQGWDNSKHQLLLLVGQEAQEQFYSFNASVVRGYNSQLLSNAIIDYALLSTGVGDVVMPNGFSGTSSLYPDFYDERESIVRVSSYYTNAGYTLDGKYTLNAATRIDQSNLFGKDKSAQNKPLWSFGLAWQLGKEEFMSKTEWVDRLVFRTSYGLTGNSPNPGSAASKDILGLLYIGDAVVFPEGTGLNVSTPANQKLTWETTRNLNFGIDFTIFKNRISGSLDLYSKNTENLIGDMPVNILTGYATITGNAGDMTNKGIDLNLSTQNIVTQNFRWSTLLNLGYNKNKITHVNRPSPIIRGDQLITNPYVQGYPAFAVFAYNYAGLDGVGDPQVRLNDGTITKERSIVGIDDVKFMGTFQPIWSGGLSNIFGYKNFVLSANVVYNLGHVIRRDVNSLYGGRALVANSGYSAMYTGNINAEFADRWKKPGDEKFTDIPAYTTKPVAASRGNLGYYIHADKNVVNASYVKLRDITLAYTLPKELISKLGASAIALRAQLSNVMLWKANSYGIDPEFMDGYGGWDGSANIIGIYNGGYRKVPVNQHTITFGAHISF